MSKIGNINLELTELAESMGIENTPANFTEDEKRAVRANLNETIRTNSCEVDCPHRQMLSMLETL